MENKENKSNYLVQGTILAVASIIARVIGMIYRIPLINILGDEGNGYYTTANQIYTILLMDDRLNEHLLEVDREAKEKVKRLVDDICKKENVTEKLKENNQMERVKLMNNFKIIAEEIVEKELVFCQKGE